MRAGVDNSGTLHKLVKLQDYAWAVAKEGNLLPVTRGRGVAGLPRIVVQPGTMLGEVGRKVPAKSRQATECEVCLFNISLRAKNLRKSKGGKCSKQQNAPLV